jgi:hypothetical protein
MLSSNRVEKNLPASNQLKHGLWVLEMGNQPIAVKTYSPFSEHPRRASLKSQIPVPLAPVTGGAAKRKPARSASFIFGRP